MRLRVQRSRPRPAPNPLPVHTPSRIAAKVVPSAAAKGTARLTVAAEGTVTAVVPVRAADRPGRSPEHRAKARSRGRGAMLKVRAVVTGGVVCTRDRAAAGGVAGADRTAVGTIPRTAGGNGR